MTSLLSRIIASSSTDDSISFAVIRRNGLEEVDVISGPIVDVQNLADIPLETGPNARDVLVLVPYRQVRERGYAAQDDGTPLRCLIVNERDTVSVREALESLPDLEVPTDSLGFDTPDEEYAEIVRRVIDHEIGQGEGANFVIRRSFRATTPVSPAAAVLTWLRTLLVTEPGAYWTFAVHTPGHSLVGATPERHISVKNGLVTMNPISGTFRHPVEGPTRAGALRFLADAKESEELFMVVDEEMKMMSAVCPGGGRILGPYLKQMSKLSHTEYLLEGRTKLDPRDVLRTTMFAPTVTGSPMENACAVIDRHEEGGRGYYSGVLAFFESQASHEGDPYALDAPILIRTAHVDANGLISVSAGATLVRMSTPEGEVAETRTKAAGVLSALGLIARDPVPDSIELNKQPGVAAALAARNEKLASFWMDSQGTKEDPPFAQRTALVIDCGDQFTEMLAHQLRHLGMNTSVIRWDSVKDASSYDLVVFGPGPGDPRQTGIRMTTVRSLMRARLISGKPLLAVCLSHQILSLLAGLPVEPLPSPRQGVRLEVDVFGSRAAIGFYNTFSAIRTVDQVRTPKLDLEISADETVVSALRGDGVASIQGHLESVLSTDGLTTLERLIRMAFATAPVSGQAMNQLV